MLQEDYLEALDLFNELIDNGPVKYAKSLYLVRGLIYQQIGEIPKSKLDFNKAFDEDNENAVKYLSPASDEKNKNNMVTINPFPVSNRL